VFFQHVLIPLDGSELSLRALAPLRHMFGSDEVGKVTLLRVLLPGDNEREVSAELERLVAQLSASGVSADFRLGRGDPSEQIVGRAEELGVDLVAMATHGRSGLTRLLRGSVAERVLRRCPRPLLLLNSRALDTEERGEGFNRILVPHDGSELASKVLDYAAALARVYDAGVVLFKVENFATDGQHGKLRTVEEIVDTLTPAKERLIAAGVRSVEARGAIGSETGEILAALETFDVDLLAMTTHGRSGLSRWWMGSVAEALARSAHCPLFLLRVSPSE